MIVKKRIIATEDIVVPFYGIRLLSEQEYITYSRKINEIDYWWWLSSPDSNKIFAACVCIDGHNSYMCVNRKNGAVRPVLIGRFCKLKQGDEFELAGYTWTVLNDELALCNDVIGYTCFRKDLVADDANEYDASDVKKWLYDWAEQNGIGFTLSAV